MNFNEKALGISLGSVMEKFIFTLTSRAIVL